jgi:hypothetical protein
MKVTFPHALLCLGSSLACTALLPTNLALACSGGLCGPSAFLPASGSLPSNALELLWRPAWGRSPDGGMNPAPTLQLYKLENGQRSAVAIEILDGRDQLKRVRVRETLPAGTQLVLESSEPACTSGAVQPAMLRVSAESPKPTQLGALRVARRDPFTTMHIPTSSGACSDDFQVANAVLELALDASAQPFADAMQHALVVDGKKRPQPQPTPPRGSWPSFALTGKLEDVLYTLCDKPSDGWTNDVKAGLHRVSWLATLPDGTELRSNEIDVELACGRGGDAGAASVERDAGAGTAVVGPDAAARADDAARGDDAGASASTVDSAAPSLPTGPADQTLPDPNANDGCSVRTPIDVGAGAWQFFAVGLALLGLGARRRRQAR